MQMKIIISHDVDHLYPKEHLKDLILPKLMIRSTMKILLGKITVKEWFLRIRTPFDKKMNYIEELMKFDKENNVRSTFFFGMDNCLGMSYDSRLAIPYIKMLNENGFDTGVHGCDYANFENIKKEYDKFTTIQEKEVFGIRMHYVRYDEQTFSKLSEAGYLFDTSEFDKKTGFLIKEPYKVGNMWEFPLCVMDSYLPYDLEKTKSITLDVLEKAESMDIRYFTILFHDIHYCDNYSVYRDWYEWFVDYAISKKYKFVSYMDAIDELEEMEAPPNI